MTRVIAILVILAAIGVAAFLWVARQAPKDDFAQVLALCASIPDPADADAAMAALGWQPLGETRNDALLDATARFHVATRRTGSSDFDPVAEQQTFDGRRADAAEDTARPDSRAYGRETDTAMVMIAPIDGMPNATGCDLFFPAGASRAGFDAVVADLTPRSEENGWASWIYNDGQAPRPGPWAVNLAVVDTDADELVDFLGAPSAFAMLSRNSFRGPLPE